MSIVTFEELKNKYQNKLTKDTEVSCKLLAKLKDGYLVEIESEWEGFIHNNHISNGEADLALQDSFKALIISGPDRSDRYLISPKALREKGVWGRLEKQKEEGIPFRVTIAKVIKGGTEVYIDGLRAFLPGRYIRLPGISQDNWVNQEIDVLIEELDYKEKKIILNHKKAVELEKQKRAEVTIQKLKEGDIVEAPALRITDFGVFVDLGGLDGLIPASELSWGRFAHPREACKVGQVIKARIFRIEKENLRVALSVKQLLGDPWEHVEHEIEVGMFITGKVVSEATFGLFIELRPGVEALLHNSEIPEGTEKPKLNSTITSRLIKIDAEERKIGLSLKNMEQEQSTEPRTETPEITEQTSGSQTSNSETENQDEALMLSVSSINLESLALTSSESESKTEE